MLRFSTVGSVDDGKSTLIGRLVYEGDGVFDDQMYALRQASRRRGDGLDFSLITDGLKTEREQSITIDVAYRYFRTPRREFIIADAPGHEQYTRNMATCASKVDLAVMLIDVRKGVLEQTRRHLYMIWILGVRRIVVVINKMDLVDYDQEAFVSSCRAFTICSAPLSGLELHFVPVSALRGDNVTRRSENMPWYTGPSILELLETIPALDEENYGHFRFPVQCVLRPNQDYRGYAGQIASGIIKPGDEVVALPSGQRTTIKRIALDSDVLAEASASLSVVLTLNNDLDLGRGDMLVDPNQMPVVATRLQITLIWMSRSPLRLNSPYFVKHTTQTVTGTVNRILYGVDIRTFGKSEAQDLHFNEIALVQIQVSKPVFCDPYAANRTTGSLILIDPADNTTVGAGIIMQDFQPSPSSNDQSGSNGVWGDSISERRNGLTVWCTGLSGSGKTTICSTIQMELLAQGFRVEVLDGDVVRKSLNSDLGFTKADRDANIRRIGFVAQLLTRNGIIVLVSAISPYRHTRNDMRRMIGDFIEVYVNAPLHVCEKRDPKGLYKKARAGELAHFTGIDDPYEPPLNPEIQCDTEVENVRISADKVVSYILRLGLAKPIAG
jgi:bifunctional enzyme CysN/CysC